LSSPPDVRIPSDVGRGRADGYVLKRRWSLSGGLHGGDWTLYRSRGAQPGVDGVDSAFSLTVDDGNRYEYLVVVHNAYGATASTVRPTVIGARSR
jgi:hypothetical protein